MSAQPHPSPTAGPASPPATTGLDRLKPERDELAQRRETLLFKRCRTGDADARALLVERFLPLAASLARRYQSSGEPMDDLVQVACLGLVKAIDRFDETKGLRFSSFAVPTILGELKRHFRDRTWAVHVPRGLNELSLKLDKTVAELTRVNGHAPSVAELSAATDATEEQVLEALDAGRARRIGSLDAPVLNGEAEAMPVGETIASARAERDREEADARLLLGPLLSEISERDRYVLRLRFEDDLTQAEIGKRVGVSQMQVSRIIRSSVARLRAAGHDG